MLFLFFIDNILLSDITNLLVSNNKSFKDKDSKKNKEFL